MTTFKIDHTPRDRESQFRVCLHNIEETSNTKELLSEVYSIFRNTVTCRIKVSFYDYVKVFVQLKAKDGVPYPCRCTIEYTLNNSGYQDCTNWDIKKSNEVIRTDLYTWQLISRSLYLTKGYTFSISLNLIFCAVSVSYKELYEDTEFTDFKLFGESDEEAIAFHRNVLAVSSPVLNSMLLGDWKEAKQGQLRLPSVSMATIQHFKDYLYLQKLPGDVLEYAKLFSLANYCMIQQLLELKRDADKMFKTIRPEKIWDLLEYCMEQKNEKLLLQLLQNTKLDKIPDIVERFSNNSENAVFKLRTAQPISTYKNLYEEPNFTDFELRGADDGGVSVHRNVLALSSPVLKMLLLGDWKEAEYGNMQPEGVSKATLQHFKDYIYLKKVPDELWDCAKLIPLASYYQMPELERDASIKFAGNLTPENTWECFEYCVQLKNDYLLVSILRNIVENDKVKLLEEYFSTH